MSALDLIAFESVQTTGYSQSDGEDAEKGGCRSKARDDLVTS